MKPELEKIIREIVKPVPVPGGTLIRKLGTNSGHIYFIEKGVARGYFSSPRKNSRTNCFKKENDFIIVPKKKKGDDLRSVLVFEAIEDMILWDFPDEQFDRVSEEFIELDYYYRIIYAKGLVENHEFRDLEGDFASEKLNFLRSHYRGLLDRVHSRISLPLSGKHISLR